jgi:hypothetical protein
MEVMHPRCCGIDVHKETVVVCLRVQAGRRVQKQVQTFRTTTVELQRLDAWLTEQAVRTRRRSRRGSNGSPSSTCSKRGSRWVLANAQHIKAVPGRKTDVRDCEWLVELNGLRE